MDIRWDPGKSAQLKRTRGVSFEELMRGLPITTIEHPTRPHQRYLLLELDNYIWAVPFVRNGDEVFLKTAFRSRVYTKKWIRGELG